MSQFYLETYVHISVKGSNALLYNTINGKFLEYKGFPAICRFLRKITYKKNLLVIWLKPKFKSMNPWLDEFIKKVKKYQMGDIIDTYPGHRKPIQLMPLVNIYKDIPRLKKDPSRSVGEGVMAYLKEISLYVNNSCEQMCSYCRDIYKQFLFCHRDSTPNRELKLDSIEKIMAEASGTSLNRLNILGGNIFQFSQFKNLLIFLNRIDILKVFYIHYLNLADNFDELVILEKNRTMLNLLVSLPVEHEKFGKILSFIKNSGFKTIFTVVLNCSSDLEAVEQLIHAYNLENVLFQPYFSGNNLRFFKKHVFTNRARVLGAKPTQKDLFVRFKLNPANFGKITVSASGHVFPNLNTPKLGSIYKNPLKEIIYKEMKTGKSWIKSRNRVQPCNRCIFELVCPPLSNYEFALKRNNLCHIHL
jgi:pseudo-rSAM protein